MSGVVMGPDQVLDMDSWVELIQETLVRLLKVRVPARLILKVVSSVVPWRLDPTPANAMHLLRSSLCCRLVGPAMAAQANRLILAEISDVPVHLFSEADLSLKVQENLISVLEEQECGP